MGTTYLDMDATGPLLGIYFGIITFLVFLFLDRVNGEAVKINNYLSSRRWHLFQSPDTVKRINSMLVISCYIFFSMPPITLIFWGSGLLRREQKDNYSRAGGIAVFLLGFSLLFFLYGVFKIKWNKFRVSKLSVLCLTISWILLTAYEITTIFVKGSESFFGISVIFLTPNAVILILVAFLSGRKEGAAVSEIVYSLPEGDQLDVKREATYEDEITKAYADDEYIPTQNEIFEMYTLNKIKDSGRIMGPFRGGLLKMFYKMSKVKRTIIIISLYFLSLFILGIYAMLDYLVRDQSGLGIITMCTVIATDVIIYLYNQSDCVVNPAEISVHIVLFRLLLFICGGNYWIYGYCILYLYFGIYIGYKIAVLRFPFMDELIEEELESQAKDSEEKRNTLDLAKTPEFIFLLITCLFGVLLAIFKAIPSSPYIPLPGLQVGNRTFEYWVYGIFAILFVAISFFAILVFRTYVRKKNGIDGKVFFYVHYKPIDLTWFFVGILYCLLCIVAIVAWWITWDKRALIVGIMAPASMIAMANAYLRFAQNDYHYFQNCEEINKYIDKHNTKLEKVRKNVRKFKRNINSKTGGQHTGELTEEEIHELARTKLKHHEDEEISEKAEEEEEDKEEVQEFDEEEDVINEGGGKDKKEEEKVPPTQNKMEKKKTSAIPDKRDPLFANKSLNKDNLFGKAAALVLDDEEVEFDADIPESIKAVRRFKKLYEWRKDMNFLAAFFKGKLRPNDYRIAFSLFIAMFINSMMTLCLSLYLWSTEGVSWGMAFFYVYFTLGVMARPFACDSELDPPERNIYIISLVMFYIWGLADFLIRFDFKPKSSTGGNNFLVWYVMFIPFALNTLTGIYKWYDRNMEMDLFTKICVYGGMVNGLIVMVLCYVYISYASGSIILGFLIILGYVIIVVRIYVANNRFLPKIFAIINFIVVSCAGLSVFIISLAVDGFNEFVGFSISYGIFICLILFVGLRAFLDDIWNSEEEPIYFSPSIFPVFKYITKKNDIKLNNYPSFLILVFLFLSMAWSIMCAVWVTSFEIGIGVTCLVEVIFIIFLLYVASFTPELLEDVMPNIDQLILKRAWLEAKNDYVTTKRIETPDSMVTYEEISIKCDQLENHIKNLRVKPGYAQEAANLDYEWNDYDIDPTMVGECRKQLYEFQNERNSCFFDEISLIIQFQLLIILYCNNLVKKDRIFLFKFLEIKKHALAAAKININIPAKGKPKYKHAQVLTQISKLPAEKQVLFKKLKAAFVEEERDKEDQILEQARIEAEKEKERQERLAAMTEEKRKLLQNISEDMPIDQMPDCEMKYTKIVERFKKENVMFEDKQFPADKSSLGDNCQNRGVAKWVRSSDIPGTILFKGTIDPTDVVQGALGDCYFLSAMSVLGDKNVRKCIKSIDKDIDGESKCGAFWVRFHKYGDIEDVIIDNFFPVLGNGEFAFARGGSDGKELWPMVLEKAYAKLNASYSNIEAGKVQYALSDMTGGVSEQIELKTIKSNVSSFWDKLKSLVSQGALLGAGSPENALGDRAINEFGIVQGHAYAVLQIADFDNVKLIQLRNPHGNKGVEWNGEWSDNSEQWSQRAKNKCKFVEKADGVFWMSLDDFIENYSYLYICRILNDWEKQEIEDEWIGESAEGLPSKNNRNADLALCPQYTIKVATPGTLFIEMTQKDKVNMFKGKHMIMFFLSNVGGGIISRMDRNTILGMSGQPINLNIVSSEIILTNKLTFPFTATLLTSNSEHGKEGEGKYELRIYCQSKFVAKRL